MVRQAQKRKRWKRWQKWVVGTVAAVLLIGLSFAIYVYSYIKSISLNEIAERHQTTEAAETEVEKPESADLPAVIKKPVEKASDLIGGQEINSQDAVDIAAILLNSGLSLKEISYLQGNASYELSNEEKQKIRNLLLEKLSPEEIELLRSITIKYGKGLVILNPEYPIEFVGETDPEQIKKNEEAWARIQADNKRSGSTGIKDTATGSNTTTPPSSEDGPELTPNPSPSQVLTDNQLKAKNMIDTAYEFKMDELAASCKASSNSLVSQIVAELNANKDSSLEAIQAEYLSKVTKAEAKCDQSFQLMLSQAKMEYQDAGIGSSHLPNWNAQYSKSKADARSSAIKQIASALKS
ncbi:hypothetical protein [Paenibacillus sp. PL2-23]|uniref:hypothetical protein n=1 Tax=Paenibacillus sp. PL2-23 TaxID=2100729 RepID=UPI0030FCA459